MRFRQVLSMLARLTGAVPIRFCAVLGVVIGVSLSPVSAGVFKNAPDAIVCPFKPMGSRPGGQVVFHVDALVDDGRVVYRPLGKLAIQLFVGTDGVIDSPNIAECHGKTVDEMREAGRAFDFR